jgi:hypothetical protein
MNWISPFQTREMQNGWIRRRMFLGKKAQENGGERMSGPEMPLVHFG